MTSINHMLDLSPKAFTRLISLGWRPPKRPAWPWEKVPKRGGGVGPTLQTGLVHILEEIPKEELPILVLGDADIFLRRVPKAFRYWLEINPVVKDTADYFPEVILPYLEARVREELGR